MHEKPTSFDIAFLAGVSQPTVSRALRGSPVVSLGDAQAHRGDRAPAQLPRRQERLEPALAAFEHAGAAAVRGSDARRLADQSVLPVDAGLDHARLGAPGLRPADLLPAALARLAAGLRRQPQGRRHHPARLRRLRRIPAAARAAGRARHALRALGSGARRPARNFGGLRQRCRAATTSRGTCSTAGAARSPSSAPPPVTTRNSSIAIAATSARCMEAGVRRLLRVAGRRHHHRGIRLPGRLRAAGARRGVRCHRRRQRSHRHRRAARAAGSRHRRAAPGGGGRASTTFPPRASPIRR